MVKTRSQQKIPFSNRKSKSRSKSEVKSGDSDGTKSCCLATIARVCREKSKDVDSIDQRSPFVASPAKRKKANSDAVPSRSVSRQNIYDKENEMATTRKCLSYSEEVLAGTIGRKTSKCMVVPQICVEVSSTNDEDCVFHDVFPSKCKSRPIHTVIKSRTSLSLIASEKRRHSTRIDQERLSLPNKRLLSSTKICNETRPYSMTSTALPIATSKQSHSCPASENATPNRQLLHIGSQDGQMYKEAKHVLHSAIPSTLLCRETEVKQINTFLKNCLVNKHPGSLYISGAPGTGKTACLTLILEQLKKKDFDYQVQFINCMNISQSHRIYSKIAEELTGWDKLTNMEAEKFLEKKFTTKGSPM